MLRMQDAKGKAIDEVLNFLVEQGMLVSNSPVPPHLGDMEVTRLGVGYLEPLPGAPKDDTPSLDSIDYLKPLPQPGQ